MTNLWLPGAALVLFAVVSVVRIPTLRRYKKASSAWLATAFGSLGLFCVGAAVPLSTVDGWLGGTNVANLLQDEFAVLGVWFFRNAVRDYTDDGYRKWPLWLLGLMMVATGAPFFFIQHRQPTDALFGVHHIDQVATLAYEDLYFLCLITICVNMSYSLRHIKTVPIRVVNTGLALLALGAFDDATFMTLQYFGVSNKGVLDATFTLYYMLFYPGASIIIVGLLLLIAVERQYVPRLVWRLRVWRLRRLQAMLLPRTRASRNRVIHINRLATSPAERAYQLVIAVHNLEAKEGVTIGPRDRRMIERVEQHFDAALPAGFLLPQLSALR
ncbi:MAG: hypothetical protein M3N46_05240 [Actinomycetota bacterium]|nr:hypothetical protein [Actinomycetota bacterium]